MDPDIPLPSVEPDERNSGTQQTNFATFRDRLKSPLASSSPSKTPYKTPLSHPATPAPLRSPQSPSLIKHEHRSIPNLQTKRSSSSLSVSRGSTPPNSSKPQLRRVSSNLNDSASATSMRVSEESNKPAVSARPLRTAETVAQEYFKAELDKHSLGQSKTIVIVHDSCYGHRFSRPRTSKAALNTIVERPERILATLLGASTAYVRLGSRHADGFYGPSPVREGDDLPNPPFLLKKTTRSLALDHPAVTHVHGAKWMEELQIMCDTAESRLALNGKELQRPIGYGKDEDGNNLPKLHEGDLYLCSESLSALQGCLGGVCDAVDTVFTSPITKRAFVCIRPPGHHCSSNYPSGFCWLNNVHVGISYAAMNHGLTHAAIIDFDLHHGDGSQTVAWDHNRNAQTLPKNAPHHKKTPIGYYSLHDINSYPCEWGDEDKVRNASLCIENAHGQSIWNVHLEPWNSLDQFWQLYESKYKTLIDKTKVFLKHHSDQCRNTGIKPKAAIFLSAGFDASQWEGQGMQRHNVNVPTDFYARFTADIVQLASQPELAVDGRVISVLEGGYSDRALTSGVLSHLCGLSVDNAEAYSTSSQPHRISNGLGLNMPDSIGNMNVDTYSADWWHESNLEALEHRVSGRASPSPIKKNKAPSNYSTPTQASTARMTDVAKERRSISAQFEPRVVIEEPEAGPPPPVDWVVASYELSRLLIPIDRQTLSCRHDELNAEATKARRERQSAIGVAVPIEPRMQLRTRGKNLAVESETGRSSSRTSNRRTTIAAVSELPDPSMTLERPRRRSSAASSILSSFQDMKIDDEKPLDSVKAATMHNDRAQLPNTKDPVVKKTKMPPPTTTKRAPARVSTPRKAKAMAPIHPASKAISTQEQSSRPKSRSRRSSMADQTSKDSMDDLTSDMNKVTIKLKMPTQEQHIENQKKAEEAKLKKPRAVRKQHVPKVRPTETVAATASPSTARTSPSLERPLSETGAAISNPVAALENHGNELVTTDTQVGTNATLVKAEKENVTVPSPAVEPAFPIAITHSSIQVENTDRSVTDEPISVPLPTRNMPMSEPEDKKTSEHVQPENAALAKRFRSDLPVFTSDSPIPFANKTPPHLQDVKDIPQDSSIWDIPDTPRR